MLVLDEINEHFIREMSIFQSTTLYYSPVSLTRNIHAATGRFANGSITSLLVIDENKSDLQFNLEMTRFEQELESLSDTILTFDHSRKQANMRPMIDMNLSLNMDVFQSEIIKSARQELVSLLTQVREVRQ